MLQRQISWHYSGYPTDSRPDVASQTAIRLTYENKITIKYFEYGLPAMHLTFGRAYSPGLCEVFLQLLNALQPVAAQDD